MNLLEDNSDIKGFSGEYSFLSNMYVLKNEIEMYGIYFKSSENAYQSSKFKDLIIVEDLKKSSPKASKVKASTEYRDYIIPNWKLLKLNIMREVVFKKFLYNPDLQEMLILTGDRYIEETNTWHDTFYGVCNGVGENQLGKILMETRTYFKKTKYNGNN